MKVVGRLLRIGIALAIIVGAVFVAGWFGANPGNVSVFWRGLRFDLSVTGAALIALAVVILAALITWLALLLLGAPKRFRAWRAGRARDKALTILSRGFTAVAAGDARAAKAAAKRLAALEPELPLAMLLKAQAAQLAHDRTEAASAFVAMLRHPDTEFLGLRGMLLLAARGEAPAGTDALALAERANALKPDARWAADALFDLKVRAGNFEEAERILQQAVRKGALSGADARHKRAVLWHQRSVAAEAHDDAAGALTFARRANELASDFAPIAVHLSTLEMKQGNDRRARLALERALNQAPHPELVAAYAALGGADEDPLKRVARMERLLTLAPRATPQSTVYARIGIADAAVNAQLWGVAREHLEEARSVLGADAPAGLFRRFAILEIAERGDRTAELNWLRAAAEARSDEAWTCRACGTPAQHWTGRCAACGAFDGLEWRSPARVVQPAIGAAQDAESA